MVSNYMTVDEMSLDEMTLDQLAFRRAGQPEHWIENCCRV